VKRVLLIILLTIAVGAPAVAQTLFVGPGILFKGGLNAGDIPEGSKTTANINFVPDINGTLKYIFAKESGVGLLFDLGYNTASYRMRPENEQIANDNNTYIYKVGFVMFAPSLYLSGFTLGAGVGLPVSSTVSNVSGTSSSTASDLSNHASPYVEIRIGGMIQALKTESGELNIVVQGGYGVTGLYQSSTGNVPYNPRPVTFGIGVNYLFSVIGRP